MFINKQCIELRIKAKPQTPVFLEDTNLVSNFHSFTVLGEADESLLEAKRRNDGVHLSTLNVVKLLHGITDLVLVGTDINEEGEDVLALQNKHSLYNYLLQSSS